jgi:hypothetical protein
MSSGFWPAITRRAATSSVAPIVELSTLCRAKRGPLHRLVLATQKLGNIR